MTVVETIFSILLVIGLSLFAVFMIDYISKLFKSRTGELIVFTKYDEDGNEMHAVKISIPSDIDFTKTKRVVLKVRDSRYRENY